MASGQGRSHAPQAMAMGVATGSIFKQNPKGTNHGGLGKEVGKEVYEMDGKMDLKWMKITLRSIAV